jgi:YD repeat-containing protein
MTTANRVSSFSDPFFYGISYTYDAVGNRTALKVNGATYATYTYDAANRLSTAEGQRQSDVQLQLRLSESANQPQCPEWRDQQLRL